MPSRNMLSQWPLPLSANFNHSLRWLVAGVLAGVLIVAVGCTGRPSRLKQVSMNPSKAGKLAMEQYEYRRRWFRRWFGTRQRP